ncbi:thiazole biosynthesis adenylyltransferase ThiF [Rossellomorea aquimaris]|uniref:thiazole biosynthesis adenylyltransferase ThiF n=1 Tax=Rossellomorea aquimaris TaxID=189382 RepID=UPI001CD7E4A0|nr:thiazole biosynthesis adenylyltransferase ThiF [Rossellomorea aquimaris]MCA1053869.1 thiazole biosynthesis adenylyltransferase ThiF [Rossellomorea aquimaris]
MNDRYSRQELFPPIGKGGQLALSRKHVLIIGAGALGTGSAEALIRAGVGKLTIADRDYVEWSNLQRQQLYTEKDALERIPKAAAAKKRLSEINSEVNVETHILDVEPNDLLKLSNDADLIIDATDNFDIRLMINDAALKKGIPWIYGACAGSYGITYTFIPGRTPCLNCLFESIPSVSMTCDSTGIISPAVMMVVSHQVSEAMKILIGDMNAVRQTLVSFDVWKNEYSAINVSRMKKSNCPSCGEEPKYPYLQFENQLKTAVLCGRDAVQIRPRHRGEINLDHMANHLRNHMDRVEKNPYLLSCQTGNHRIVLFKDGRALIHGTKDIKEAKSLYHRYFS